MFLAAALRRNKHPGSLLFVYPPRAPGGIPGAGGVGGPIAGPPANGPAGPPDGGPGAPIIPASPVGCGVPGTVGGRLFSLSFCCAIAATSGAPVAHTSAVNDRHTSSASTFFKRPSTA